MKYLIGIDVGTQGLRACLFRQDGQKSLEYTEAYPTQFLQEGRIEQDPEHWWGATIRALRHISQDPKVDVREITAISYACSSCTTVVLDNKGRPLRPALIWMDERAEAEAEEITNTRNPVLKYSGGKVSPQWMLPKTLWLMRNEKEIFKNAFRIVEQTDFFTYRLTGVWTLSYNNLVAKWNYASPLRGWPEGFLESAGVIAAKDKWPNKILPVATKVGRLLPDVARVTGLPEDIWVVQGGIDSHAGMVGLSAIESGEIGIVMGTSTVVMAQADRPIFAEIWGPYPDAVIRGTYTLGGGQTTTGSVIQWLAQNVAGIESNNLDHHLDQLENQARSLPPGGEGLIALNYFQGNRTPLKDSKARGAIWGLTLWHGLPHLLRAFYEANAFGNRHILENLEENGYEIKRIFAGGGGTRSKLSVQILADVCARPIRLVKETETTAMGAAIWAGLGSGVFQDYRDAVHSMVKLGDEIVPGGENVRTYDFYYDKYRRTYYMLKDLMHEVVDFETERKSIKAN